MVAAARSEDRAQELAESASFREELKHVSLGVRSVLSATAAAESRPKLLNY